jgi:hypothetical protein
MHQQCDRGVCNTVHRAVSISLKWLKRHMLGHVLRLKTTLNFTKINQPTNHLKLVLRNHSIWPWKPQKRAYRKIKEGRWTVSVWEHLQPRNRVAHPLCIPSNMYTKIVWGHKRRMSVCSYGNRWRNSHEIWCERYATGCNSKKQSGTFRMQKCKERIWKFEVFRYRMPFPSCHLIPKAGVWNAPVITCTSCNPKIKTTRSETLATI